MRRERSGVLVHDPALERRVRPRLAEQVRANERDGWAVDSVAGPESPTADRDAFAAAYEQTMRRAGAAERYFFARSYFDSVLGFEPQLADARARRGGRGRRRRDRGGQRRRPPLLPRRHRRRRPRRVAVQERGHRDARPRRRARAAAQPRRRGDRRRRAGGVQARLRQRASCPSAPTRSSATRPGTSGSPPAATRAGSSRPTGPAERAGAPRGPRAASARLHPTARRGRDRRVAGAAGGLDPRLDLASQMPTISRSSASPGQAV